MIDLCFSRIVDGCRLDNLVVLRFHGPGLNSADQAYGRLFCAVTAWAKESESGRLLWEQTHETLNIGDIQDELVDKKSTLRPFLLRHGLEKIEVLFELVEANDYKFDGPLVRSWDLDKDE